MKRILVTFVFLFAALSLLIGTPALSSRVSGLTQALLLLPPDQLQDVLTQGLEQLPPDDLEQVLENIGVSTIPAPVPKTGATYNDSSAIGDDGELQMGVTYAGPERFTDHGDGTVTDNLTGLVWTKNANIWVTEQTWSEACNKCNQLANGEGGLSDNSVVGDWRLPNLRELNSLVDYGVHNPALPAGHPFVGEQVSVASAYWSSTTNADYPTSAWRMYFLYGNTGNNPKTTAHYVWCVRGGQ